MACIGWARNFNAASQIYVGPVLPKGLWEKILVVGVPVVIESLEGEIFFVLIRLRTDPKSLRQVLVF